MLDVAHDLRDAARDPVVGARVADRFTVIEPLGRGGMGRVYRARQDSLGRDVALKLLPGGAGLAVDPDFERRFLREASATARVRHPHVVSVYEAGRTEDGGFFLALEMLEGPTLAELLEEGPLPWSRAALIGRQVASALGAAHAEGLIHCDLKPSNVVIERGHGGEDFAKLLDFGVVRLLSPDGEATDPGGLSGSPRYMAPEQAKGLRPDPRTDVYALGVLLYELVTGRPPFLGGSPVDVILQHVERPPRPPRLIVPDLPAAAEVVILRCLNKDRDQRYANMAEVAAALDMALQGVAPPEPSRWPAVLLFLGATLAALLVGLGLPRPWTSAEVHVESEPPGATVREAGQVLGRTPLVLDRPAGRTLELTLEGEGGDEVHVREVVGEGRTTVHVAMP